MKKKLFIFLAILVFAVSRAHAEDSSEAMGPRKGLPALPSAEDLNQLPHPGGVVENLNETPGMNSAVEMAQNEMRDPFKVTLAPEAPPPSVDGGITGVQPVDVKVSLEGIGLGAEGAYAVLNGDIFYEGEEKKGIKLVAVRKTQVDLLINGNLSTFYLAPEEQIRRAQERQERKKGSKVSPPPSR
ncbi:MAG TPA: hypothetical protein PLL75_03255 [Candidatus Omnitrophota bacterium]|nr:hypothetical protein [Candidatus Omnitrophota bacterium]HPS36730.1 hypothetical protein [Candidatus Omnitrophota bacterium]